MKTNEFMLGNFALVYLSMIPIKIAAIHKRKVAYHATPNKLTWIRMDLLRPIPLTEEILEKNGFEEWDGWLIYSPEGTGIEIAWVGTILKIGGECSNLELPTIEFVHQLQNVFTLCGIKKEIEL